MTNTKSPVIKSQSSGYGYTYASLSDIANQGIEIPKMRVAIVDGRQFIEYFDGEAWQLGAQIITDFASKGMNVAQAYGSALTYARRYTVQLAKSVAVDDDKNVEVSKPAKVEDNAPSPAQIKLLEGLLGDNFEAVMEKNKPLTKSKASKLIESIKNRQVDQ